MSPDEAVLTLQRRGFLYKMPRQPAPAERCFPLGDLPETVPTSGEGGREVTKTSVLCTEDFIGEGLEFMDHWEVQIESSEGAAGAGGGGGGRVHTELPGSPEALVRVP